MLQITKYQELMPDPFDRGLAGLRAFSIPAYAGSITEVVARRKLDSELSIPAHAGNVTSAAAGSETTVFFQSPRTRGMLPISDF